MILKKLNQEPPEVMNRIIQNQERYSVVVLSLIILLLTACSSGGDDGEQDEPRIQYDIGVTVSGLEGDGLVLQNNGGDDLPISTNGMFIFTTSLDDAASYNVTIASQPTKALHVCDISNNTGVVAAADIMDILVECSNLPFPDLFDTGAVYSNQLYVANGGDDFSGDGSQGNPYATIEKAASVAGAGTQIKINSGTYSDTFIADLTGSPTAPIALVGIGSVTISSTPGLQLSKPRYVVLDNLTIQGESNGLNIDDGGDVANPNAAEYVIVKNSTISSTGAGNNDAIKASGVNSIFIVNNTLTGAGGGSGIDFVGCHNAVVSGNDISGSMFSGVQTKGGSSDIIIHGNTIHDIPNSGGRGINAGGSTDIPYFRPPLVTIASDPSAENFEAARITMLSNVIINVDDAVAFTGCVDCVFANNTIVDPLLRVARILQESTSDTTYNFAEAQNGEFLNNIVRYSTANITSAGRVVNIGPDTVPATFVFNNNLWWAYNEAGGYVTTLPAEITAETISYNQLDPLFFDIQNDFHIDTNSPAIGKGTESVTNAIDRDFDSNPYASPPELGAFAAP